MTTQRVISVRLSEVDIEFLQRNGLPISTQLRYDLQVARALERAQQKHALVNPEPKVPEAD